MENTSLLTFSRYLTRVVQSICPHLQTDGQTTQLLESFDQVTMSCKLGTQQTCAVFA